MTGFLLAIAIITPAVGAGQETTARDEVGSDEGTSPDAAATAREAIVTTSMGSFAIRLLSNLAPRHVEHFVSIAEEGGYDGTTFHRVIPGGIIQGGDPLSRDPDKVALYGTGGLGVLDSEFSARPMARGAVAAVLLPNRPNSGGSQFFVVLFDQPALTGKYTIFGEVISGMEVADRIGQVPVEGDRPRQRIEITSVTVRSAE
jgi:peptidyl-prolyl cis-trans isomerase B (cyclophilin B)